MEQDPSDDTLLHLIRHGVQRATISTTHLPLSSSPAKQSPRLIESLFSRAQSEDTSPAARPPPLSSRPSSILRAGSAPSSSDPDSQRSMSARVYSGEKDYLGSSMPAVSIWLKNERARRSWVSSIAMRKLVAGDMHACMHIHSCFHTRSHVYSVHR